MSGSAGVRLVRGANTALTAPDEPAGAVLVGLWWSSPSGSAGTTPEVDALLVLLDEQGRVRGEEDFVFFSQAPAAPAPGGGAHDLGQDGEQDGEQDLAQVRLDLGALPPRVVRVLVAAAIFAAVPRRQTFAQVEDARLRVADASTGVELARHDLEGVTGAETAMVLGEVYRHRGRWKVRAVGQGYTGGLAALAREVGLAG